MPFEPVRDENQQFGSRPGPTQIRLYSDSIKLEAWNVGYKKNYLCGGNKGADQLCSYTGTCIVILWFQGDMYVYIDYIYIPIPLKP